MSLRDLKKSKDGPKKKKQFTVDEFIADAENYAQGQPKIVSENTMNCRYSKLFWQQKSMLHEKTKDSVKEDVVFALQHLP